MSLFLAMWGSGLSSLYQCIVHAFCVVLYLISVNIWILIKALYYDDTILSFEALSRLSCPGNQELQCDICSNALILSIPHNSVPLETSCACHLIVTYSNFAPIDSCLKCTASFHKSLGSVLGTPTLCTLEFHSLFMLLLENTSLVNVEFLFDLK